MRVDVRALETALGYAFRDAEILTRALTHKSRAYEDGAPGKPTFDNEQFEFLGDAVLGFIVSEWLVRRYPGHVEGQLSKLKAHLVSANHLFAVAQRLDLGQYMLLGRGEEMSGGRVKRALLGDALEALLAAIYLDGGVDPARAFIERFVLANPEQYEHQADFQVPDFKSALKERAQLMGLPRPNYVIVEEGGPEHSKVYKMEARIGNQLVGRAEGPSKKVAGQRAAQDVLRQLPVGG